MRKYMAFPALALSGGMILTVLVAFGQEITSGNVPAAIQAGFQTHFPTAYAVEWEIENGVYEAEFKTGLAVEHEAWFDVNGTLIKHEEDITRSELPEAALSYIQTEFNAFTLDDLNRITTAGEVRYTVEVKTFTEAWKLIFNAAGSLESKISD